MARNRMCASGVLVSVVCSHLLSSRVSLVVSGAGRRGGGGRVVRLLQASQFSRLGVVFAPLLCGSVWL